jgi:hypothetical protein
MTEIAHTNCDFRSWHRSARDNARDSKFGLLERDAWASGLMLVRFNEAPPAISDFRDM